MKIAIGCDHIAFDLKEAIKKHLIGLGHEVKDCGAYDKTRTHYPIYGHLCASLVAQKQCDKAVIMCGTGIGIVNSANKTKGARAALVNTVLGSQNAVETLNSNIIAVGAKVTGEGLALMIVDKFLTSNYKATPERDNLINKINGLINRQNYDEDIFEKEINLWGKNFYHD